MQLRATPSQRSGDEGSKMIRPTAEFLVGNGEPALGQQIFDGKEVDRGSTMLSDRSIYGLRRECVPCVAKFPYSPRLSRRVA